MTPAILLLVTGVFSLIVWPPFYRRVAADPRARDATNRPTRFLRVHSIIIGSAVALAVLSLAVGVLSLVHLL
jgi:hypothetical protein